MNFARQGTCKLLLQVKQKFVINFETLSRKRASPTHVRALHLRRWAMKSKHS